MKLLGTLLAVIAALAFAGNVFAVPPGKTVEFTGGGAGKVVFDGATHADKGLKCSDCHTKIFPMKKGGVKFMMSDINAGKYCGTCHNGTKAFSAKDPGNCSKCHKK